MNCVGCFSDWFLKACNFSWCEVTKYSRQITNEASASAFFPSVAPSLTQATHPESPRFFLLMGINQGAHGSARQHQRSHDEACSIDFVLTALPFRNKIQFRVYCNLNCVLIASASVACWQSPRDVLVCFPESCSATLQGGCAGSFECIEKDPHRLNYFAITDHLTVEALALPSTHTRTSMKVEMMGILWHPLPRGGGWRQKTRR